MKRHFTSLIFISLSLFLVSGFNQVCAQEKTTKCKVEVTADIMSRYIWRGLNLGGSSPSLQPNLKLKCGNFILGSWGAYSFNSAVTSQETDLYLSYTLASLVTFTATDYFFPKEDGRNHYFNYKKNETAHVYELSAKFLGTQKFPFSLQVATNVYGADARKNDGDSQYSTYVELGYNFKVKENSCSAFLGFTPNKPDADKGESGYYGPEEGIINIGITATREIKITDSFSLPVNASLITNPQSENIYLVLGISL